MLPLLFRVDTAPRLDGVGILRFFVWAISLDACEAKREPASVARTGLQVVEGDFDDKLRANVDSPLVARDLSLQKLLGLPGKHRVGHALEGLAEHDELSIHGVDRAEVQVREPALASAVAPFRGEGHQGGGVDGLDLETRRAAR